MPYILGEYEFSVKKNKDKFKYSVKCNDNDLFLEFSKNSPLDVGKRSDIGKYFINFIKENVRLEHYDKSEKEQDRIVHQNFVKCKDKLNKDLQSTITDVELVLKERKAAKETKLRVQYANIQTLCKEKGWTLLQLLSEITKGLGVGVSIEIMRSYFAFFQTACGVKGTNVILIGDPGQGKTWTVEGALNMITQENIVYGIMTESSFYETYAGKDVTGLIFYLGDLGGGDKDDEKTIRFRNVLKQLTSDGKVKDTITKEGIATPRFVEGNPALTYTTADETIINEQEKSRAYIGYPPIADTRQIATYNSLVNGKGKSKKILDDIAKICKNFRSVVHHFKDNLENYILINPYMFSVEDFLRKDKNYNRKSKEFEELLRIVAVLSDVPLFNLKTSLKKTKEKDKITDDHLIVATKQNNIDALILLNSNNGLLPPDIDLANGLFKEFDHLHTYDQDTLIEDPTLYIQELKGETLHDDGTFDTTYCFSGNDLKVRFKTKDWLLKNKSYLFPKLHRLADEGLIIKIGKVKSSNENIYCLSPSFLSPIKMGIPHFKQEDFKLGLTFFEMEYLHLYKELETFLLNDFEKEINDVSFNTGKCHLFDLLWEDERFTREI